MSSDIEFPPPAKIYLDEWMKAREIGDQKALAKIMNRSEGAISKKFNRPELIDLRWLAEFAQAFAIDVTLLFQNPLKMGEVPPPARPQLLSLMQAAAKLSDHQIEGLISILLRGRDDAPHEERGPAGEGALPATSKAE